MIRNFQSFPSSAFTITTSIKFTNLITDEKQNFHQKFLESNPKIDPLNLNDMEYIVKFDTEFELRGDHFRFIPSGWQHNGSFLANRSRLTSFLHNKRENKYKFNPRKSQKYRPSIICLKGKERGLLEMYVDTEQSNNLFISVK